MKNPRLSNYKLNKRISTTNSISDFAQEFNVVKKINTLMSSSDNRKKLEAYRLAFQLIGLGIFAYFGSKSTIYVILLSVPLALLIGPVYCGWMCPRGMFQEIFGRLGRKVLKKRYNVAIPKKFHPRLLYLRYALMVFVLITLILSEIQLLSESIQILILEGLIGIMIVSVMLSFFVDRAACRYFCKEGAVGGLTNLVKLRKIKRDSSLCNSCGICDKVCPMWIEVSKKDAVKDHCCISCFKCVQRCPVNALCIDD